MSWREFRSTSIRFLLQRILGRRQKGKSCPKLTETTSCQSLKTSFSLRRQTMAPEMRPLKFLPLPIPRPKKERRSSHLSLSISKNLPRHSVLVPGIKIRIIRYRFSFVSVRCQSRSSLLTGKAHPSHLQVFLRLLPAFQGVFPAPFYSRPARQAS